MVPDSKHASEFIESPNHRNGRIYPITRVTIHHAAAVCNAKAIASVFVPRSRSASATYCIGNDGSIVQCVKESDMPWTSSNFDNDNRAITIEVANSSRGGQWPVGAEAMASLINLLVDICQRNPGIGRLRYTGDLSGNLTMHKWFTSTQCPGPYLESKFSCIAEEVNKRLDTESSKSAEPTTKTVYKFEADNLSEDLASRLMAMVESEGYTGTLTKRTVEVEPAEPVEPSKPVEPVPTDTLAIGDKVRMAGGAPVWGQNREFKSWVYNATLYVRAINGDCITVSIYKSGAITGTVHRKYLTKV